MLAAGDTDQKVAIAPRAPLLSRGRRCATHVERPRPVKRDPEIVMDCRPLEHQGNTIADDYSGEPVSIYQRD